MLGTAFATPIRNGILPPCDGDFVKRADGVVGDNMIIWSGVGIFVAIAIMLSALFANLITDILTGGTSVYWDSHKWPLGVALLVSAGVCWVLHRYVIQKENPKILIEKETGKEVVLKNRHTFFFIPVMYWMYILLVIGFALIIKDAVSFVF